MKKYKTNFSTLVIVLVISALLAYEASGQDGVKWSGKVSFYEKTTGTEGLLREWRMDAIITNDTGTAYHTSTWSSDKGSGRCNNQGKSELDVGIDDEKKTYGILAHVPGCIGTQTINGVESVYPVTDETGIAINDQPLGTNRNVLSGRTVTTDRPDDVTTITTIYEWNLRSGPIDVELIVTPQNYDNWLPEPGFGGEEWSPGNKMTVLLRVQKRGGGKPAIKARFFELRLNLTSREKGTTLNFPLNPPDPADPDLNFLEQEDAVLSGENQFIRIPVDDGINGYVEIGSFDGGGWSDLTAVAILENGDSIKGNLIRTGGIAKIPIPKRNAGSKIAVAWLKKNGFGANYTPADIDDHEVSDSNHFVGDGLSVYEEYRGFFAKGEFQRFDPNKKELGIRINTADLSLFSEGISWFESASDIRVVPFYTFEIGEDARLNKNGSYAQDYLQYAVIVKNGMLMTSWGKCWLRGVHRLSARRTVVVIDYNSIRRYYNANAAQLRYSLPERIARTTAHEIAHSVQVDHHGEIEPLPAVRPRDSLPPYLILKRDNSPINPRPRYLGNIGNRGNAASGDLSCFINYFEQYTWAYIGNHNGSPVYYQVPPLLIGKTLCVSNDGTDINDSSEVGINGVNKYFGKATSGNCKAQLQLR